MNAKLLVLGLIFLALFMGCIQVYEPSSKSISLPDNKEECEAMEGIWSSTPVTGEMYCDKLTSDAGKECIDSDECEGHCRTNISKEMVDEIERNGFFETKGECSNNLVLFGCQGYVEEGRVAVALCID